MFKPKDTLDRLFEIGIIAKGLNGLAELVGGLLLLFETPGRIRHLAMVLTQGELSEDPHDFVAHYILPLLSPEGLTRGVQIGLGVFVILINAAIYTWIFRATRTAQNP